MPGDSATFLPIDQLQPNPFQPRNKIKPEELSELADSIRQYGILESLVVAETPVGYQIIAGERRWRAAQLAGLTEVPVLIKQTSPRGMLEMAIIENVQRIDLHPVERAKAFLQLQREFGYTASQVAEKVSKSAPYVSNTLRLLDLPDAIKDGLINNEITEGHARAIAGIPDQKAMVEVYKRILKEGASVRQAEELARRAKSALTNEGADLSRRTQPSPELVKAIASWEDALENRLTLNAAVKVSQSNRQTKVTITLKGSPEEATAELKKILV